MIKLEKPKYYVDTDRDVYRLRMSNNIVSREILCRRNGITFWMNRGYLISPSDYKTFYRNHKRISKDKLTMYMTMQELVS